MVEVYSSKRVRTQINFDRDAPRSSSLERRKSGLIERYVPHFDEDGYNYKYLCFLVAMSVGFVMMLLLFGGVIFMALEYDNYADRQALKIDTENRIAEYHTQYNVSTEYLDLLTQRALLANIREENKWNVISASYFSITIVSTIGFGWWAPLTDGGKIFMILYALFGIPVFLYASFQYVAVLTIFLAPKVACFCARLNFRYSAVAPLLTLWITTLIVATISFYTTEDWNLLDSIYFCIETGTTIALGDLEPIKEWNPFTALVNFHCFLTFIGATLMLLETSTAATGEVSAMISRYFFPGNSKQDMKEEAKPDEFNEIAISEKKVKNLTVLKQ